MDDVEQPAGESETANDEVIQQNLEATTAKLSDVVSATVKDAPPASETIPEQDIAPQPEPQEKPKKRGRGRPRKTDNVQTKPTLAPAREPLAGVAQAPSKQDASIKACAEMSVMMVNTTGLVLAGGEDGMMTQDEKTLATGGFEAYFHAKGVDNIPAWVILAGSLTPYYMRVMMTPSAKTKVATGVVRVWMGIKNLFKRGKKNARPNSGNDNVGKDDSGSDALQGGDKSKPKFPSLRSGR